MLKPDAAHEIPQRTREVAQAAFPRGARVMTMRDELGEIFADEDFAELFSWTGQPGISPAQLALGTVMQYMANLTDLQEASVVRGRLEWENCLDQTHEE